MPSLALNFPLSTFHLRAVLVYERELAEIVGEIDHAIRVADVPVDQFMPSDIKAEYTAIQTMLQRHRQVTDHGDAGPYRLTDVGASAVAAALTLAAEDLDVQLVAAEANLPSLPGVITPLRTRQRMLRDEFATHWAQVSLSPVFDLVHERWARKRGSILPPTRQLADLCALGEGQEVEFMLSHPEQAHELAKEIAAFGTTNPGTIVLGVANDGKVVGLPELSDQVKRDQLQNRIAGVASNVVSPALGVRVSFEIDDGNWIARIAVPKGIHPLYYSRGVPYVRHVALSQPASPQEVIDLVLQWQARRTSSVPTAEEIDGLEAYRQLTSQPIPIRWG